MDDGFYWIRHGSYTERGPYFSYGQCRDGGIEGTWYSTDFVVQQWEGGNMIAEWRDDVLQR